MSRETSVEERRVLDLFSGIGGFSLGLERAGFHTVAFCEIAPYCRAVLARHWPLVPCYTDVRELNADRLARDGIGADIVCGGFPCQDISVAGKGAGLKGERSGLWAEMFRLVRECRPNWVLIENVPRLRTLGADRVLGDLESAGYTGRPLVVAARHTGAPHRRSRVWIVANANSIELRQQSGRRRGESRKGSLLTGADGEAWTAADSHSLTPKRPSIAWKERSAWPDEPPVLGVDDELPDWVDRKRAIGNAVDPKIPEIIGRAILRVMQ